MGQRAVVQLEGELRALAAGELPAVEPREAELEALPLVIGADGGGYHFDRTPARRRGKPGGGRSRWRFWLAWARG